MPIIISKKRPVSTLKGIICFLSEGGLDLHVAQPTEPDENSTQYFLSMWSTLDFNYRPFEQLRLQKGMDSEVLALHLEIEARENTPLETFLIEKISRAMTNAFEQKVDKLPYFVRTEQHLI